jgi:phi13 family phage major tail protein|nr:Major tail protein [Enterococcus phage Planchet]DAM31051.1 MAG TPA: tail tube protein [Caudoviricetes sp.]
MEDTVRIGLSDLYAFPLKNDEKGNLAYGAPFKIAPAVSASISPSTSDDAFYADDIALISNQTISSIAVELETADIKDEIVAKLMGLEIDEKGVVHDNVNKVAPKVALAFRSLKSNNKYKYVVLYKGSFGAGEDEYATKEDSISFQTTTITGTFLPTVFNGDWRASVNEDAAGVDPTTISEWFTKVYGATTTDPVTTTSTTRQ